MESARVLVAPRPRLSLRAILGLCATGISLILLVFPGELSLPSFALMPVFPRTSGCANFLAPALFLAFFALGVVISVVLIVVGVVAIVLTATRVRGGVVTAVVVNAVIATLLLVMPLSAAGVGGLDQGDTWLSTLAAVCAVLPLTGTILLMAPSLYGSSRLYLATLITTGLLLLPGAAGLTVLGLDLAGAPSTTPVSQAHC